MEYIVQKKRANGAFQKDECRNFVKGNAYRAFQNWQYVADTKGGGKADWRQD